jgi:hypothetical protein
MFFNNRVPHVDAELFKKYGGVELILSIMKHYPDQESLQTTALFALGSIVMKTELHRETVYENNGIRLILEAMKRQYPSPKDKLNENGSPEPILYSRGTAKIQCSKPLLLQLFGSVCLLNLSDTGIYSFNVAKCKLQIVDFGGIQAIFDASDRVKDQNDLWYIVYYIFTKFTNCGGIC